MLVCSDLPVKEMLRKNPALNRVPAEKLARQMFPDETLMPIEDASVGCTSSPGSRSFNGCFDGLTVVAAKESGIDYPSKLPSRWLAICGKKYAYFHAMYRSSIGLLMPLGNLKSNSSRPSGRHFCFASAPEYRRRVQKEPRKT